MLFTTINLATCDKKPELYTRLVHTFNVSSIIWESFNLQLSRIKYDFSIAYEYFYIFADNFYLFIYIYIVAILNSKNLQFQ